jgi:chorismate dehydratase
MADGLRIGMVNFINTAPFYSVWKKRNPNGGWKVIEAVPSRLNRLLHRGELDLGIVSSHEYALHPEQYFVLDGLSISSSGPVGSVYLFADYPLTELDGKTVRLSPQSQTSNSLVRILLEIFFELRPRYLAGSEASGKAAARVAIGDEALRLYQTGKFSTVLDLGQAWHEYTGLPFVFAVWAVRREMWERHAEGITGIKNELLSCIEEGRNALDAIAAESAPLIPMAVDDCCRYLKGIEYDLGETKKKGLDRFFELLIERKEVPAEALPVSYCG